MAAAVFGPWYAASAKMHWMKGKKRRVRRLRTSRAPSRSCIAAEWTTTFNVQQQAERVDQDMPFAAGDLLGRIKALRVKRGAPC
jgi:hypothetical protein